MQTRASKKRAAQALLVRRTEATPTAPALPNEPSGAGMLPASSSNSTSSIDSASEEAQAASSKSSLGESPQVSNDARDSTRTKRSATAAKAGQDRPNKRSKASKQAKRPSQPANELPHGLGTAHAPKGSHQLLGTVNVGEVSSQDPMKQERDGAAGTSSASAQELEQVTSEFSQSINAHMKVTKAGKSAPKRRKRPVQKTKDNPYGLMPGQTPFPDWNMPSVEDCRKVHELLTAAHGEFSPPEKIPPPSTTVAGCGEVPDLVDAMIRTVISGHTTMKNANLAVQSVINKYGQWGTDTIGAGSIDWNKVRLSGEAEIADAVRQAGLGLTKGRDIKCILDMVFEENQQRRAAYLEGEATGEDTDIVVRGAANLDDGQKQHQIRKIEQGILTMDHVRGMGSDEAMLQLTKYPGIGVKTASCLLLFCLQQPSFAVDTHVWRICKWLGWVPPKATRDDTYMHGEVRIPDDLKYGLHQLFIRHGKECGRCRGGTVEGTREWLEEVCPLEDIIDRFDKKKTKVQSKAVTVPDLKSQVPDERGSGMFATNQVDHGASKVDATRVDVDVGEIGPKIVIPIPSRGFGSLNEIESPAMQEDPDSTTDESSHEARTEHSIETESELTEMDSVYLSEGEDPTTDEKQFGS